MPPEARRADHVFKAVADPTRRAMLDMLRSSGRTAKELSQPFAISQPAASRHLKVLRTARLVTVENEGRYRLYRLNPEPLKSVFEWAEYYSVFWSNCLVALGSLLDGVDDS
jgi:DNA-binding transcriptional ArsR family regulator